MTRVVIAAILLAFAPAALAQDGSPTNGLLAVDDKPRFHGWQGPKPHVDCTCRHQQGRAEVGETLCIRQGHRLVTAQCQMALNNPFWQVLREGCDEPSS